jgi:hypothetical protein
MEYQTRPGSIGNIIRLRAKLQRPLSISHCCAGWWTLNPSCSLAGQPCPRYSVPLGVLLYPLPGDPLTGEQRVTVGPQAFVSRADTDLSSDSVWEGEGTCTVSAVSSAENRGLPRTPGGTKLPPVQGSSQGRLERL